MIHKMIRPFIVKVSVLGYFPYKESDSDYYEYSILYMYIYV